MGGFVSMKLNLLTKKIVIVILIPLVYLAGGCDNKIDIKKVQEFAEVAEKYENQYEDIVKDIYQSCLRDAQYRTDKNTTLARRQAEQSCLQFGYSQQRLLEYHQLLAKYTAAVRTLSSDELIEELDGAGKLASSIINLPIPNPIVNAGGGMLKPILVGLANAIQKAIANQYRTEVLEESIEEINKEVQLFIVTLAKITDKIYSDNLFQEANGIEIYYAPTDQGLRLKADCESPLENETLNCIRLNSRLTALSLDKQRREEQKSAQINQKLSKVHSYILTMKEMANRHQELYDSLR